MRYKTPRKPARQVVLFCFVILLLLGGMGIILISIREENRAYSDGQAEADSLLEELRPPSGQEAPETTEEQAGIVLFDDSPNPLPLVEQDAILPTEQETVQHDGTGKQEKETVTESQPVLPQPEATRSGAIKTPPSTPGAPVTASSSHQPAETTESAEERPTAVPHQIGAYTGVDLTAAQAKNSDFVAWLKIPGTNVDYPVVLSDNTAYYLTHSFTGKQSKLGTLFSLKKTDYETPGQNIAIYGHHITNTSSGELMFRPLLSYKQRSFYEKHSTVYLDSLYHSAAYKIFAVVNLVKGEWDPSTASFASYADFLAFVRQAQARSLYDTGVEVTAYDHILTLITCDRSYAAADGRLIVLAVEQ